MTTQTEHRPRGRNCLTCANWDVRITRTEALQDSVARCNLPEFRPLTLVVSGSGGCDRWAPHDEAANLFRDADVIAQPEGE